MKVYVCCLTEGSCSDAETTPRVVFVDEDKAKEWVTEKDKAWSKMWKFQYKYEREVQRPEHPLHKLASGSPEYEDWIKTNYYDKREALSKELDIGYDEHSPEYFTVDLVFGEGWILPFKIGGEGGT